MKQPNDEAYYAILEAKYSRIISEISEMHDVPIEQAMDIFYTSELHLYLKMVWQTCIAEAINILLKKFGENSKKSNRNYIIKKVA